MKLSPPRVIGPVSEYSQFVRVQGQLTGGTVLVMRNGVDSIVNSVATWSDEVFALLDLPSGLQPGDKLTALQKLGSDSSEASPDFVEVQKFDPASLRRVIFTSHLYVWGRHLVLDGMAPGAVAEAGSAGSRGKAPAVEGLARLTIDPPLKQGEMLDVRQVGPNSAGPDNLGPKPDQPPKLLPPPIIDRTAYACDRSVHVSGVIDGADVTLFRDVAPPVAAGFDLDHLWFAFGSPMLQEGEKLSVSQELLGYTHSQKSDPPLQARPAKEVPRPRVPGPLCEKSTAVLVSGLTPGTIVRILQDGAELAVGEAPAEAFAFNVQPLSAGVRITAQQKRCDTWSQPSEPAVRVSKTPSAIPSPVIPVDRLYECGVVIPVVNVYPGSWLKAISKKLGQISEAVYSTAPNACIPVRPALIPGDWVWVTMSACAARTLSSQRLEVQSAPDLPLPQIVEPVEAGQSSVVVQNVVPGAIVEVYLNETFCKAVNVGLPQVTVDLEKVLRVGDQLKVRQLLCNNSTFLKPIVVVVKPKPSPPVNLNPNGVKTDRKPTLSWTDPGMGQEGAADSYALEYTVNGGTQYVSTQSSSYSVPNDLPYSARATWHVRGKNTTGQSDWSAEASFTVKDGPRTVAVTMTARPDIVIPPDKRLYVGTLAGTGSLQGIFFARQFLYRVVCCMFSDRVPPEKAIALDQGNTLSGLDMELLYGSGTPLPVALKAYLRSEQPGTVIDSFMLSLTYQQ
jgi:hypothetical protein